jgi:ribosome-binding factor A
MSKRQAQVSEIFRRHISIVFQEQGIYIYGPQPLVTVTHVMVTTDLALAKVYLSIYNSDNPNRVMEQILLAQPMIRQNFYKRVRHHIRRVPELDFYIDDTTEAADTEEALFQRLHAEHQMGEEE